MTIAHAYALLSLAMILYVLWVNRRHNEQTPAGMAAKARRAEEIRRVLDEVACDRFERRGG